MKYKKYIVFQYDDRYLGQQSYFRECEHGEIGIVEQGYVMLIG